VAVGAMSLAVAVFLHDGTLAAVGGDPAAAVWIAFLLSVVAANEVNRYRVQLRRELLDRRRAEAAVRRLAARLESRVAERTGALEEAHHALRQHQAELAHLLRLHTVGEMAASLAHEINQPLGAIANYAQGSRRRLAAGSIALGELSHTMGEIAHEAIRAGEITRWVRALVRKEEPHRELTDISQLVTAALAMVSTSAQEHGVELRFTKSGNLPRVEVDRIQIEQVILNLVLNAIDAVETHNGRREI